MFPYIDAEKISRMVETRYSSPEDYRRVVDNAEKGLGINANEAAILLTPSGEEERRLLFGAAGKVKQQIYGSRVVLFAPLYLSNDCKNNCLYCGFRKDNKGMVRRTLSTAEVIKEAVFLEKQGHKRLLLVGGESEDVDFQYLQRVIQAIYSNTDIRRVNINVAPAYVAEFEVIKSAGIGTYQLFQETYHKPSYEQYHPSGRKADYHWRISAFDRALRAGIDDIGLGVLFGLYDYKHEVLALIQHAAYLERTYGVGPHTISVPRLKPAFGAMLTKSKWSVSDEELKIAVAVLRLALPYTGIILSTREREDLRRDLLQLGVSQISAGSCASPGGYSNQEEEGGQFELYDKRSLDQVVASLCKGGFVPSFCTACYRSKRTGEAFMKLAKAGDIKDLCLPNALLTLKEHLLDYAGEGAIKAGEYLLDRQVDLLEGGELKRRLLKGFELLEKGERDIYL